MSTHRVTVKKAFAIGVAGSLLLTVGWSSAPADRRHRALWTARYDGSDSGDDEAHKLAVNPNGAAVYVIGTSESSPPDYATVAYDQTTGAELWNARYDGPVSGEDTPTAVGVSPDGTRVFVTGQSSGGASSSEDFATIAYDANTGSQLWVSRFNASGLYADYATALGVSPDGAKVFVTGHSGIFAGDDYSTVAYDASTGTQLWVARYAGSGSDQDAAKALIVTPDGLAVIVTGEAYTDRTGYDIGTVAYDASTGARLWVALYDRAGGGPADYAVDIGVGPDGQSVYVTGYGGQGFGGWDFVTVAYRVTSGEKLWASFFSGPAGGDDETTALTVSPDGSRVFVTGQAWNGASNDFATVAYEASTGATIWVSGFDGFAHSWDRPMALSVAPDGSRIYATGFSWDRSGGRAYATVAYDAVTGGSVWVARGTTNSDVAEDVGVAPDGRAVFVTGTYVVSLMLDFGTVAYAP